MRTLRLLLIVGIVAAVALFARLSLLAYGVYAVAAALLISEALAATSVNHVLCLRDVRVDRAKIGETVEVSTIIRNDKPLPVPWMLVEESLPRRLPKRGDHTKLLVLRPYGDVQLRYSVTMSHRGYHQIGPVVLESGDLFGFVRRFRAARAAHYITVQPAVTPILRYDVATRRPIGEVRVQRLLHEDPTRLAGVREYVRGDSLSRIHWKATARTGTLHSRIYERTTMSGALLAVDFHGPSYGPDEDRAFERSELAVKVAASIAVYLIDMKQHVALISNGLDAAERAKHEGGQAVAGSRAEARRLAAARGGEDRLRPVEVPSGRGHDQSMRILDALARLELSEGLRLDEMLMQEFTRLPRDLTLLVVAPSFDARLFQAMARVKFSGFRLVAVVIDNPAEYERIRLVLAGENIETLHIRGEADLLEIAERGI
jgi:uncharacterized protein (DUF58 family)